MGAPYVVTKLGIIGGPLGIMLCGWLNHYMITLLIKSKEEVTGEGIISYSQLVEAISAKYASVTKGLVCF